ncbi:DNA repair and recombination protein rad54b [Mortierella antarctica]|nr:DNA repair and recombination protein rad54b [Mortierella antarctica]
MPLTTKFKAHAGLVGPEAVTSRPQPRHIPDAPHAILLPRPPATHPRVVRGGGSKRPPGDAGLVDVVIDPILGQHLRPHQRAGVQFLYECVMQMKDITGQGAILADEMGLGKTLQTITLLWTLLKQSPYYGEESSVVKRVLVVCPASLITNWCKEFKKWLGDERLKVFAVDYKSALTDFTLGRVYPVMVIGYEKAIRSLSTKKRIILSGTPLQNHLSEYYSMINFVNPGLFESYSSFKKVFEDPIVKSRQPDCTPADAALGLERSQELTRLTGRFILRRTAQVNLEYLPPKTEIVVFCPPSPLQNMIYRQMTDSSYLKSCFSMVGSRHLTCITALRKLCNSPQLTLDQAELKDDPEVEGLYSGVKETIMQSGYDLTHPAIGGKLGFVDSFLRVLKRNTLEKVVLVSNFTQTLDILEAICVKSQYGFYRLDGSGTIEEKMYQRQLTKIGLSDALMDGKSDEKLNKFSMAELRDLFTFHEEELCLTHTLLECDCSSSRSTEARSTRRLGGSNSGILNAQSKDVAKKELQEWKHVDVVAEQQRHEQAEEGGSTTLPSEDKILWRAICGEGRSDEDATPGSSGQDEQVSEAGFVFIKSSAKVVA